MAHPDTRFALPWLRVEAFAVLALTIVLYGRAGAGWGLFAGLWLLPDLGMLGYLAGPKWGARSYNAVHTYLAPAVLALAGLLLQRAAPLGIALIWFNHIAFDRVLGYGLKSTRGFGETNLKRLGKRPTGPA